MDAKIVILGFRGSSFTYVSEEALRILLLCINRFHLQLKLTAEAFGGDLRMRAGALYFTLGLTLALTLNSVSRVFFTSE
jgi:hypothetical protein